MAGDISEQDSFFLGPTTMDQTPDASLSLHWSLGNLPTVQHVAGLAGLVLMINWLHETQRELPGTCEIEPLRSADKVSLRIDRQGLRALFDWVYASVEIEQLYAVRLKKHGEVLPPLREETVTVRGKQATRYVYKRTLPAGAFLAELEAPSTVWLKLWREMIWGMLRCIPKTRTPYEARLGEGSYTSDADALWDALIKRRAVPLTSALMLGMQSQTAEGLPCSGKASDVLLLHFWPYAIQVYIPQVEDREGTSAHDGYTIVMPEISNLPAFVALFPELLKERSSDTVGFRPKDALLHTYLESGYCFLIQMLRCVSRQPNVGALEGVVRSARVFHLVKSGKLARIKGEADVVCAEQSCVDFGKIRESYWHPGFRNHVLRNTLMGKRWYEGLDTFLVRLDSRMVREKRLAHDFRVAMRDDEITDPLYLLVDRMVKSYLTGMTVREVGAWKDAQEDEERRRRYGDRRQRVKENLYYRMRKLPPVGKPTGLQDLFLELFRFAPRNLGDDEKAVLYQALTDGKKAGDVRIAVTLALLPLQTYRPNTEKGTNDAAKEEAQ